MSVNFEETKPLENLEELLVWNNCDTFLNIEKLRPRVKTDATELIVCHDMKGGYLDDRFNHGSTNHNSYRFFHWSLISKFIYFSHKFITIPPLQWINAAHTNGVQVLGTLITEHKEGRVLCDKLFESIATIDIAVDSMVKVTKYYGFEGWLINIENELDKESIPNVLYFLRQLTIKLRNEVHHSCVLWYDSVLESGKLLWQNELNTHNKSFFDVCDGIYLNYNWDEKSLDKSRKIAPGRWSDIYVGVDVFTRGDCPNKGGFESFKDFLRIKNYSLSTALFAPGWCHEVLGEENFTQNQIKLWSSFYHIANVYKLTTFPLETSFCQGFGLKFFESGNIVHQEPWSNLCVQALQPSFFEYADTSYKSKLEFVTDLAFNGGGCLKLSTEECGLIHFRLFETFIKIDKETILQVEYTFLKVNKDNDVVLQLNFRNKSEIFKSLYLIGSKHKKLFESKAYVQPENETKDISKWITKTYIMNPYQFENFHLETISATLVTHTEYPEGTKAYLGQIKFKSSKSPNFDIILLNKKIEDEENYKKLSGTLNWLKPDSFSKTKYWIIKYEYDKAQSYHKQHFMNLEDPKILGKSFSTQFSFKNIKLLKEVKQISFSVSAFGEDIPNDVSHRDYSKFLDI